MPRTARNTTNTLGDSANRKPPNGREKPGPKGATNAPKAQVCDACYKAKRSCDMGKPACARCIQRGKICTYPGPEKRRSGGKPSAPKPSANSQQEEKKDEEEEEVEETGPPQAAAEFEPTLAPIPDENQPAGDVEFDLFREQSGFEAMPVFGNIDPAWRENHEQSEPAAGVAPSVYQEDGAVAPGEGAVPPQGGEPVPLLDGEAEDGAPEGPPYQYLNPQWLHISAPTVGCETPVPGGIVPTSRHWCRGSEVPPSSTFPTSRSIEGGVQIREWVEGCDAVAAEEYREIWSRWCTG